MADPVVGFRVRIFNVDGSPLTPGVDNADDAWEVWTGGGEQLVKECKAGKDSFKAATTGGQVVLQGAVTSGRKAMMTWFNDTIDSPKSKTNRRMVTITELSSPPGTTTLNEGKQTILHECFLVAYSLTPLDAELTTGNVMEEVVIKPIRVELK